MNIKEKMFIPYFVGVCVFSIAFKFFSFNFTELLFYIFNLIVIFIIIKNDGLKGNV